MPYHFSFQKRYNNADKHICPEVCCTCCLNPAGDCALEQWFTCNECRRSFRSQACYNFHMTPRTNDHSNAPVKTTCARLRMCRKCNHIAVMSSHKCESRKCPTCKEDMANGEEHVCFISCIEPDEKETVVKYMVNRSFLITYYVLIYIVFLQNRYLTSSAPSKANTSRFIACAKWYVLTVHQHGRRRVCANTARSEHVGVGREKRRWRSSIRGSSRPCIVMLSVWHTTQRGTTPSFLFVSWLSMGHV